MRVLAHAAFVFLAGIQWTWAHSDPRGDVHPTIAIRDEQFIVTSTNNIASTASTDHRLIQVFDRSGRNVSSKRDTIAVPSHKPYPEYSFMGALPEEQNGLERRTADGCMIIPEWERKHGGRPYIITAKGGAFTYGSLNWVNPNVHEVVDAIVGERELELLVTRFNASNKPELWLHRFSLVTFNEEASLRLPKPCLIYSFPTCSNLLRKDDVLYIAVAHESKRGYNLTFVSWNPATGANQSVVLSKQIDWNTSIALAHIDDDALIAYHYPGTHSGFFSQLWSRDARIQTIYTKLKKP